MTITDDAAVDDGGPTPAPAPTEVGPPAQVTLTIWRGDPEGGEFTDYVMPAVEGEVVLDVIHRIQATEAPDLACRWNCKAGKCGWSCSAEINGKSAWMCMTRMHTLPEGKPRRWPAPWKMFPIIRDLVTDVKFNYEKAKRIPAFKPGPGARGRPTACSRSTWSGARSSASASKVLHVPWTSAT